MRAHHVRDAIAVVAAVGATLLVSACGDPDTRGGAGDIPAASPGATSVTTIADVPSTTNAAPPATTAMVVESPECPTSRKTIEFATEAFYAQYGRFPGSERELVEMELLREASGVYSVDVDTGEISRIPGVPCPEEPAPETSSDDDPLTVDRVLAELGEDGVAMIGGEECAREFAEIALAGDRFIAREGRDPESLDELAGDLEVELTLWSFDAEAETLVPAEGSPCVDVFSPDDASTCEAERNTLQVAVEAYTAQYGAPPASEEDLVGDFLREPIERFDLDGSAQIVVAAGGPCDTVPATTAP